MLSGRLENWEEQDEPSILTRRLPEGSADNIYVIYVIYVIHVIYVI